MFGELSSRWIRRAFVCELGRLKKASAMEGATFIAL
jgi:hypothetical protein